MWRTKSSCSSISADVCFRCSKTISIHSQERSRCFSTVNQLWRNTFEQYAKRNQLSPTDWYKQSSQSLDEKTQQLVSKQFKGSLYRALCTIFPEVEWKAWRFQHQVPKNFWKEQSNQRKFFDDLGHQIGIQTLDDWYSKLSLKQILSNGGRGLLSHSDNSPTAALMAAYPEHNWIPWKFNVISIGYWNDVKNQRKFFDDLGKNLGVEKMDDWYSKLSYEAILQNGGSSLMERYKRSPSAALMAAYPEHNWIPWKFNKVPQSFWKDINNQRKFFDDLGKQLGVQTLDDWYPKLTYDVVQARGGSGILFLHQGSPQAALMAAYPEHNWISEKFNGRTPNMPNVSNRKSHRKTLEEFAVNNNIKPQDWYHIDLKNLEESIQNIVGDDFKGSLYHALSICFPETEWHAWKFKYESVPRYYWEEQSNQRKFFDDLGHHIGIQTLDDWYQKLTSNLLNDNNGGGMLKHFNGSPQAALMAAYPEHNWIPWKFKSVPHSWWKDVSNQRRFFDELGTIIGIQSLQDWYDKLSTELLVQHGASGLLLQYKGSPAAALMAAYPEHKWIPWKLKHVPKGYWSSKENVRQYMAYLSEKLSIQTLDDWYRVDFVQLKLFGATSLVQNYKGLYNVLKEQYPHHTWDPKRFQQMGKKGQRWLVQTVKKMFPNEEILEDYMHPKAILPSSSRPLQLDVYIPSRSLAFEYQGMQHYQQVSLFVPTKACQERDEEKRTLCAANNIKLIEVPYWWNRTQESLQQTIDQSL